MGRFLDSFKAYLEGSRSAYAPVPELFPPVDLGHLRRSIRIEEKARENAEQGYPRADAEALDAVELDIKGRFEEVRERYLGDCNRQLRVYGDRISNFNAQLDLQTLDTELKRTLGDLPAQSRIEASDLWAESEDLKAMAQEVKNFRKHNMLQGRLPHFPKNRAMVWAVLAILTVVELLLNFFLLREAGDALQVIVQSLLYGFVNVVIPFTLFAGLIRYASHAKKRLVLFGLLVIAVYVAYLLAVNLLMAHYRAVIIDAAGASADQALLERYWNSQSIAYENFRRDWFGLKDIWSWFLFLGGCALSLGGLISGYKSDDRYPGYGSQKRKHTRYYDHYVDGVQDTTETLRRRRDAAIEEIGRLRKTLAEDFRRLPHLLEDAADLRERGRSALGRIDTNYNTLVQEYRKTNQQGRDVPEYFRHAVALDPVTIKDFHHDDIQKPQKAVETLQRFSDELYQKFDELIGEIESTRQVLEDDYPFKVSAT